MPLLRGLLRDSLLRESPVHPETMVLLVSVSTWPLGGSTQDVASQTLDLSAVPQGAADDGRSVLLRCRLLHPQEDVPVSTEGRAGLQCLLHQAPRQLPRSASCVIFILIQ